MQPTELATARLGERIGALPEDDWRKHDARFQEPAASRHIQVDRLVSAATIELSREDVRLLEGV